MLARGKSGVNLGGGWILSVKFALYRSSFLEKSIESEIFFIGWVFSKLCYLVQQAMNQLSLAMLEFGPSLAKIGTDYLPKVFSLM